MKRMLRFGIIHVRFSLENCDKRSLLAQLVEHYLDKVGVSSSSLLETTIFILTSQPFGITSELPFSRIRNLIRRLQEYPRDRRREYE